MEGNDHKPPKLEMPSHTAYDVGYGKPPQDNRFKPGQSGNPKGRPKGAKNKRPALNEERLKTTILDEAYRTINVKEGTKTVTIPMATAVVRALAVNAARGNNRAALIFTQLVNVTEQRNAELHASWLGAALDYKIAWEKELNRRKQPGIVAPDPIPHPDDVVVNPRTGMVRVMGPMTKDEKELWDAAKEIKTEFEQKIASHERRLRRQRDPAKRQETLATLNQDRDTCEGFANYSLSADLWIG